MLDVSEGLGHEAVYDVEVKQRPCADGCRVKNLEQVDEGGGLGLSEETRAQQSSASV